MRKGLLIFLGIVAVIVIGGLVTFRSIESNLERLGGTVVEDVELDIVADGTYTGSFRIFPLYVKVEVQVLNHEIMTITIIEHVNGEGLAAEAIIDDCLESQSLTVDAIAGATYSSKAILLAIRNALTSGGN